MNRSIRGFTLIEVMIAMSILTVIMGMALAAFTINENYRDLTAIRVQLYRQNKRALDIIAEELAKSRVGLVYVIDNGTSDQIRFQIPLNISADGNFTVPWGGTFGATQYPGCFTSYQLSGRYLIRRVVNAAGSAVSNTDEVKAGDLLELQISNATPGYFTIRTTSSRNLTMISSKQLNATSEAKVYLLN